MCLLKKGYVDCLWQILIAHNSSLWSDAHRQLVKLGKIQKDLYIDREINRVHIETVRWVLIGLNFLVHPQ